MKTEQLKAKAEVALERRMSTVEMLMKPSALVHQKRKQSVIGGKVILVQDLPWKSGNPDGSCSLQDLDMVFVSNCMTGLRHEINNKRSLLRFQFLDCVIATACIKYLNSGICNTIPSALDMFVGNHLVRYGMKRDDRRFIDLILPSRPIDTILQHYLTRLRQSFGKLSTPSESNPKVRTLNLQTWLRLCELLDTSLDSRVCKQCFMFSKVQGIVDVFGPNYHRRELTLLEFVEAVTRVAFSKQVVQEGADGGGGEGGTVAAVAPVLKEVIKLVIKNAPRAEGGG